MWTWELGDISCTSHWVTIVCMFVTLHQGFWSTNSAVFIDETFNVTRKNYAYWLLMNIDEANFHRKCQSRGPLSSCTSCNVAPINNWVLSLAPGAVFFNWHYHKHGVCMCGISLSKKYARCMCIYHPLRKYLINNFQDAQNVKLSKQRLYVSM